METTTLKKLHKGDYFKIIKKDGTASKTVYVKDDYSYEARKFFVVKFYDVCDDRLLRGDTVVTTDFIF